MAFVDQSGWLAYFAALANVSTTLIWKRTLPEDAHIYGPAYGQESYVVVRWTWFIMPAFLVAMSVLLLLLTAVGSA
ncbi:hypothetical protein K505DRAFT_322747 [Melanomma pulvis-pyrius CBS 109.77]|uniref:Uncharacterized protein n=1 Tax=Melanomma pulvis-pyrius CBS 109.77 TaxID=1314802 RepID=A0A6A6XKW3_9PLEO|nr:hypothetical protein K505DRAFT_322747 [Melanomma pulvis-pyrius CBS 109.77]